MFNFCLISWCWIQNTVKTYQRRRYRISSLRAAWGWTRWPGPGRTQRPRSPGQQWITGNALFQFQHRSTNFEQLNFNKLSAPITNRVNCYSAFWRSISSYFYAHGSRGVQWLTWLIVIRPTYLYLQWSANNLWTESEIGLDLSLRSCP